MPTALSPQERSAIALSHVQPRPGTVLARVNGEDITWEDYVPYLRQALFSINSQNDVNWDDPIMQQRLLQLQNDVVEQVIDRWIMNAMAAAEGMVISDTELSAQADAEKARVLGSGQYADWASFLKANDLTDETFVQVIYDTLLLKQLISAEVVDPQSEQVHLRHILLTDLPTAEQVYAKLQAGGDWTALAAEYSVDEQTKGQGGDLGWSTRDELVSLVAEAAYSLAPGSFSEPIRTAGSYTIIYVVERGPHALEPALLMQRQKEALMARVAAEREKAQIEYLVDFTTPVP